MQHINHQPPINPIINGFLKKNPNVKRYIFEKAEFYKKGNSICIEHINNFYMDQLSSILKELEDYFKKPIFLKLKNH